VLFPLLDQVARCLQPVIETIIGRRATSFDEFAMRNAAIFRGEQPAPRI
jgi:hypothetical protein